MTTAAARPIARPEGRPVDRAFQTVDQAVDHYDRFLAEHYTWMLGGDLDALAAVQRVSLSGWGVTPDSASCPAAGSLAVDLGCGPGHASLALAGLGFDSVLAVDLSRPLLSELAAHAAQVPAVRAVRADVRTALRELVRPGSAGAVVCLGDTLTHLPTRGDVAALFADVAAALAPGGTAVFAYRDLTVPLTGTDRFLPVRATEDRIMTCFLEYPDDYDDYTVVVHDLIHTRDTPDSDWTLTARSYRKLRLSHTWVVEQLGTAGLRVRHEESGPGGMRTVVLERGT
ncbi:MULTISPECIES: class I SAM-dependent methyltransferase [unclassified Streptomyces]|uniref:class I SAM-dependent methyltransferase n=1 Tax=unclassified Streptomyces TaxID=2593676 RepID=UPI002365C635|nr:MULTISPECIES: class I SAM-dependent methyltransferase [unclassified Streptomyces]MDF3148450.1 class I SAM-dependent methyltransferase [Streptomyces sp. T21Q-yed]WDF38410.1 class I SAM-dependent methyltransferase [Streptomyces sp. T12]